MSKPKRPIRKPPSSGTFGEPAASNSDDRPVRPDPKPGTAAPKPGSISTK